VKEEINKCCAACKTGVVAAPKEEPAPVQPPRKTTKNAPKMFSDLGDMFGH
jgi:hypothetical protein